MRAPLALAGLPARVISKSNRTKKPYTLVRTFRGVADGRRRRRRFSPFRVRARRTRQLFLMEKNASLWEHTPASVVIIAEGYRLQPRTPYRRRYICYTAMERVVDAAMAEVQ